MTNKHVIVAGHLCLDLMPDLSTVPDGRFYTLCQPGRMVHAGKLAASAGGVVANTGLALYRLGVPVQLIGKIGQDLFGEMIQALIREHSPELVNDLVRDPSTSTGYTIIINPPGEDRAFLHAPGSNDMFYASDLSRGKLKAADLFHFGYPSLMRSIYRGDGGELVSIMQRARREGLTTSLDYSLPDPTSPAGLADWPRIMANSLPYVDCFLPNAEELVFLFDRKLYHQIADRPEIPFLDAITPAMLHALSDVALSYGVKLVLVKVGHRGIYLRTASADSWKKTGRALEPVDETWFEQELWAPVFQTEVQGNTGAGDAASAGFLAGILNGGGPEAALQSAAAAGAASVSKPDAVSGLRPWGEMMRLIEAGWETGPLNLTGSGWQEDPQTKIWRRC